MKKYKWIGLIFLLMINGPAYSFSSVDEQIDHYLNVLSSGSYDGKIEMLKRLQWSGLSDPRLYNAMEQQLNFQGMLSSNKLDKQTVGLLSHQIRALGYSGNERYRNTLDNIKNFSANNKFRKHAKKALIQLDKFKGWNQKIADSDFGVEGKSVEIETYMKMLNVDDVLVQRLAARAIFHEQQRDPDLLALTADNLIGLYMQDGLDKEAQDTAAWFCKALGQNGYWEYGDLLSKVAADSPYKKIRKYALKYTK